MHALKAEVEHLKEHATYLARQVNEVSRERDTLKVEIERLKDRHERDQEELGELDVKLIFAEAHVRTLREALSETLILVAGGARRRGPQSFASSPGRDGGKVSRQKPDAWLFPDGRVVRGKDYRLKGLVPLYRETPTAKEERAVVRAAVKWAQTGDWRELEPLGDAVDRLLAARKAKR